MILLTSFNARWTHSSLSVYYLRTALEKGGFSSEILELTINQELDEILSSIYKFQPDILAISVYIWNSNLVKIVLPELKKILPNVKIVLGGPEVSYNTKAWLSYFPQIDYIIVGAGEAAIVHLAKNNFDLPDKIIFKMNSDFSEIPFPYNKNDFDRLENKYIYYESSRGCPFKCSYCLSSREDQNLQYKNTETVEKELEFIAGFNPKIIKFIDRTYNANREHARKIWLFLMGKNFESKFHFEIHPGLLEEEDFNILSKVKNDYFQFEIGVQSLNKDTLQAINRKMNWDKVSSNILRILKMDNIHIHLDLIPGLPHEDFESFKDSFNRVYKLKPHQLQLGFLKVLPGTLMEEKSSLYGMKYLSNAPYTILKNNWLGYAELIKLHNFEKSFDIFYNSHNFDTFIENIQELFPSYFLLYEELSKLTESYPAEIKNMKKTSFILCEFIKENFNAQKDYLEDCLRWDWAKKAKSHYYPNHLNFKELKFAKENGFEFMKETEIGLAELKRAIYFTAKTKRFKSKYQQNKKITVFLASGIVNLPFED